MAPLPRYLPTPRTRCQFADLDFGIVRIHRSLCENSAPPVILLSLARQIRSSRSGVTCTFAQLEGKSKARLSSFVNSMPMHTSCIGWASLSQHISSCHSGWFSISAIFLPVVTIAFSFSTRRAIFCCRSFSDHSCRYSRCHSRVGKDETYEPEDCGVPTGFFIGSTTGLSHGRSCCHGRGPGRCHGLCPGRCRHAPSSSPSLCLDLCHDPSPPSGSLTS